MGTMTLVAGHTWVDTPAGKACATCPMTRRRLHTATEADIDKEGWAHLGALNHTEYGEIVADRKSAAEEWERIWDAVREVGRATT